MSEFTDDQIIAVIGKALGDQDYALVAELMQVLRFQAPAKVRQILEAMKGRAA